MSCGLMKDGVDFLHLLTFKEENIDGIAFSNKFLEFPTFQKFFLQIPGFYSPNSEN
jgi:hypothetical protein